MESMNKSTRLYPASALASKIRISESGVASLAKIYNGIHPQKHLQINVQNIDGSYFITEEASGRLQEFYENKLLSLADFERQTGISYDNIKFMCDKCRDDRIASKLPDVAKVRPYVIDDKMYLARRYITGNCPYCGYEKARGDQCENCTKVLEPTDLINPKSTISGSSNLEVRTSKHLFLNLPKIEPELREWLKSKEAFWPDVAYSIALKWLKEGLEPRCITRDLKWGFPVPKKGYEDKVFYVWFDAPIGYIGITKQWESLNKAERNWKDWWMNPTEVRHVEFMGKDNVPYHSITFPATLLGTKENWTQVDFLKGSSYLTYEGGKFSKSENRGVFAEDAVKEFDADYWRYWLIANAPESSDSAFTWDLFAGAVNKDLNGVLGNFVSRVLKMTSSKLGDVVPAGGENTEIENQLIATIQEKANSYIKYMELMEFRKAMAELRSIWVEGNNYITVTEPWSVIKTNEQRAKVILRNCINLIRIFAILSAPIMPNTSQKMLDKLKTELISLKGFDAKKEMNAFKGGESFEVGEALFERISDDRITELKEKYGSKQ